MIYAILGIIGGLLCAVGDCLLDLKGKDNHTLDKEKMINSAWLTMKPWRFQISLYLSVLGVPFIILGAVTLAEQISQNDPVLGHLFQLSMIIGGMGGFFVHALLCIIPILFQELSKINDTEKSCHVIQVIWKLVAAPFILLYLIAVPLSSILQITAICKGALPLPLGFVCVNPLAFMIIGILCRKILPKYCQEIPGIFMPSLGLGTYGLCALLLMI